ncbi:MAG: hypothetical protein U0T07_03340 [Chitinophagales bacterium]
MKTFKKINLHALTILIFSCISISNFSFAQTAPVKIATTFSATPTGVPAGGSML